MMTAARKLLFKTLLMLVILLPSFAFASNSIMNIRHWAAPDHTRIVFDTSEESQYNIEKKERRVVIDFADTLLDPSVPQDILLKKPDPSKVSLTVLPENRIRVEIAFPDNVNINIFMLKKVQDKPDRLVIDLELPEIKKQETQERQQVKVLGKDRIVVIDPGHGGEAPGAVGKKGTMEKDVVLSIGKHLRYILNKKRGYRAFMTRDGDYYVPFKNRMTIAREYGADLFISIHADAALNRYAKGSSVYCLSVKSASNEAVRLLARNENMADLIGGSPNGEAADQSDAIVLNMFQTNTINVSKTFGYGVLKHLSPISHLKYNTVQEAPFMVLKLPNIPSLLVETAYISNPKEEKLLRNQKFQKTLAEAISKSIMEFLSKSPSTAPPIELVKENKPSTPVVASERQENMKETSPDKHFYIVKENDSLAKIALAHNTTVENLLRLNKMGMDDALYVGQKLNLTASSVVAEQKTEEVKTMPKTISEPATNTSVTTPIYDRYRVKKGDSIEIIARRHGMSTGDLLKLNDMKYKDVLFVGRKLKVTASEEVQEPKPEKVRTADGGKSEPPQTQNAAFTQYRVKNGDSIEKIARRHSMTINALLELNDMKYKDVLFIGRKLKVAASEDASTEGPVEAKAKVKAASTPPTSAVVSTYKVKEGDSLDKIARRHGTTIGALLRLNNMKMKESLYVGRIIKINGINTEDAGGRKLSKTKRTGRISSQDKKDEFLTYQVKKGDTIDMIARRHKVSPNKLLSFNNMSRSDLLFADKKLKIPRQSIP